MNDTPINPSEDMPSPLDAMPDVDEPIEQQPPAPAEPVQAAERVAAVDVLRGVALLGILAMNIVTFGWPFSGYENPNLSGGDSLPNRLAWMLCTVVFSGKMMTLFSMLFGAGLVLMSERAEERGASIRGSYLRRLFWLWVIGMLHAYLIWNGDILVYYALCGFLLLPMRRLSPTILIATGTVLFLINLLIIVGVFFWAGFMEQTANRVADAKAAGRESELKPWEKEVAKSWQEGMAAMYGTDQKAFQKEIAVYRDGGYLTIVKHRAAELWILQIAVFIMFMLFGATSRMLLGMGLMKLGVFAAERSWRFYIGLAVVAYLVGLSLTGFAVFDLLRHDYSPLHAIWGGTCQMAGTIPMALGHASIVMMLCKAGAVSWLTSRLAAVGRMALTNYLMHSVICSFLFYGYGFGLHGRVDRLGMWGIVVAIWVVQLVYSPIWLRYFRFGPAEWLWRSLSYGKLQPLTRPAESGA